MKSTIKQVIVIRTDLKLPKGKLCVQVAHAAVTSYNLAVKMHPEWAKTWLLEGQKKIVVKVKDIEALLKIYNQAKAANLPVAIIKDAGLTVIPPGTITCIGIGPAPNHLIDPITGNLKLV
ncbi:MAG: peptidyl-tRNA hydrolase Pth2 [Candidatus Njordarchaeia archaeon]|nr:peptidyl-tRNA hydrolase [Candidatus Korarchaeota archaeon]